MVTRWQLIQKKQIRRSKFHRIHAPALRGCPQKKGICLAISITRPKKPNSAERPITKIFLSSTRKKVRAHIPGETHTLKKFSRVLIRGGRVRDLIGIRYRVIRGVGDAAPVYERKTSRSQYGVPRLLK